MIRLLILDVLLFLSLHAIPQTNLGDSPGNSRQVSLDKLKELLCRKWPENRTINIVFHGHSVPAGYFDTPNVHTLEAYPFLTLRNLKNRYPFAVINVIVTAIGGENAVHGAMRFNADVLSHHPDIIFIDYGLNDRWIDPDSTRKAWIYMITSAQAQGIPVCLLTPSPDLAEKFPDSGSLLARQAMQIRHLAAEYHTGLVDSYAEFEEIVLKGEDIKLYMAQSNHPNHKGHEIIAESIMKWFDTPGDPIEKQ